MYLPLYSLLFSVLAVVAIIFIYLKFKDNKISLSSFILLIIVGIIIIVIALNPNFSIIIANIFGISRGLDSIFIVSIIGFSYLYSKLYFRFEKQQQEINKIVREIAINNEVNLEKDENKK